MSRQVHGFFRDEQGDKSLGRVLGAFCVGFTLAFVLGVTVLRREVSDGAWHILEAVDLAVLSWIGVPRVARYFKREAPGLGNAKLPEDA